MWVTSKKRGLLETLPHRTARASSGNGALPQTQHPVACGENIFLQRGQTSRPPIPWSALGRGCDVLSSRVGKVIEWDGLARRNGGSLGGKEKNLQLLAKHYSTSSRQSSGATHCKSGSPRYAKGHRARGLLGSPVHVFTTSPKTTRRQAAGWMESPANVEHLASPVLIDLEADPPTNATLELWNSIFLSRSFLLSLRVLPSATSTIFRDLSAR